MRVVIVGAGKLGYKLAEFMIQEDIDVTLIDNNPNVLDRINEHIDVLTIEANGIDIRVLKEIDIKTYRDTFMNNLDLQVRDQFVDKYKLLFIPICIILLVATTILYDGNNTVIRQNIQPLFVCTGVFTAFFVASRCIIKYNIMPNKMLVSSCFFIYAIHGVELPRIGTPLELTTRVLHYIIPGNTGIEEGFCYIISPIVTAFLCILLLMFARRSFPKLTLYFSGNR